jgi:hypothetical protein
MKFLLGVAGFILACGFSVLGRIEYFSHVLRFHSTGIRQCCDSHGEPLEDCKGHLVCESCEEICWNREDDPWHILDKEDEDDLYY